MKDKILKKGFGYLKSLIFPLILYVIFAMISLFSGKQGTYFSSYTTEKIFQESVLATLVGIAIAVPLKGGRWDFATGTISVLGGIIGLNLTIRLQAPLIVGIIFTVFFSVLLALLEGLLYIVLRVPNMIVSLGVVMIYEAMTNILFDGKGVNVFNNTPEYTAELLQLYEAPWCYVLLVLVILLSSFLLYYTRFGADNKSLGLNSRLAINAGVKEKKNILLTYVFIGVLLGFAAILNASKGKVEASSNLSSTSLMFSSMGPVLVGLFLEQYSTLPFGVFVGALGFNIITYGLQALNIDSSIQTIITGIAIVLIMAYTTNQERLKNLFCNMFTRKKKEA
jgi:membrane protein